MTAGVAKSDATRTFRLRVDGERSRRAVLDAAAGEATVHGLGGLTLGKLAAKMSMSKSGLHALFGSKEGLELAIIETARAIYHERIVRPALQEVDPHKRLIALCDNWLSLVEQDVFPGGCFFASANAEFDTHPGPVRDQLAFLYTAWRETINDAVVQAQAARTLPAQQPAQELTFQILGILRQANDMYLLYDDASHIQMGRTVLERLLKSGVST
jgi:AcrR family transcriptional regulator